MLKLDNISKKYKNNVVFSNLSFEIKKGEVIGILGKSGSGKSTLLKCINRLENIDSGNIYFNNMDFVCYNINELRQKIGIVFQDYSLFEHLNVLDNLTLGLIKIKNISKKVAEKEAIKLLNKIGLKEKIYNYPSELSGGQRQRVAIARSLILKPEILMLDEPTSALDKEMKQEVLKLILDLVKEDMTLIIVSHEENFIKKVSDKIITIKNGKASIK